MDEYEVIGVEDVDFTSQDGTHVQGKNIYGAAKIAPGRGVGQTAQKFFLSKAKLDSLSFQPQPGQVISVLYNRWGKPQSLTLINDITDIMVE